MWMVSNELGFIRFMASSVRSSLERVFLPCYLLKQISPVQSLHEVEVIKLYFAQRRALGTKPYRCETYQPWSV